MSENYIEQDGVSENQIDQGPELGPATYQGSGEQGEPETEETDGEGSGEYAVALRRRSRYTDGDDVYFKGRRVEVDQETHDRLLEATNESGQRIFESV